VETPILLKPSGFVEKFQQGIRTLNRPDGRDRVPVFKNLEILSKTKSQPLDTLWGDLRCGRTRLGGSHKGKIPLSNNHKGDARGPNLGPTMKRFPLVRKRPRGPLCGYISKTLRDRTCKSREVLEKAQDLILGTSFETSFVYISTTPYLNVAGKFVIVKKTPNLGQTCLMLHQLLRCNSNFPWERLLSHCDIQIRG